MCTCTVVHARNRDRLTAMRDLLDRGAAAVVGDLSDLEETHGLARDVNRLGRMDAVIHNAGVYTGRRVLPVNVVAPYLLTALIDRPQRLVYLSSGMHRSGRPSLTGVDWSGRRTTGSYPDSKLFVTTLAVAVAQRLAPPAATGIISAGPSPIPPYMTGGSKTTCSTTWLASPPRASSDSYSIAPS
jgi:NAD(P)-dependent dehydrogenase (short-subunit alcohol dehydrogenase family)